MRTVKHPHDRENLAYYLQGLIDNKYTLDQVSRITGYTKSHLCVLKGRFKKKGEKVLINGHKGMKPKNTVPDDVKKKIIDTYRTDFDGVNFHFFRKALNDYYDIHYSYRTIYTVLTEAGIDSPEKHNKPKKDKVHRPRYRRDSAGDLIHTCIKQCVGLVYVISGNMRLSLLTEEGKEVTLLHIEKNKMCVLAASCVISQITFQSELTASEDTELLIIPAPMLARLIKDNIYAKCTMYQTSTQLFSDVMWSLQNILFSSIDKRLATFLISESEKTDSDTITLTQETIAVEINTAREVVARMLKRFSSDGLISSKRGIITLTDTESLRMIAER